MDRPDRDFPNTAGFEEFLRRRPLRYSPLGGYVLAASALSACGGGGDPAEPSAPVAGGTGGSAPLPSTPTGSAALTLTKTSTGYQSSAYQGFTLLENNSKYFVADQETTNAYNLTFNASGSGLLEFEFSDEDDIVTFREGSAISGFSQLKVLHGTVDFSEVDLSGVKYVAVASSAQFSFEQANTLEAIVSNSPEGKVTFKVSTQAQAEQLQARIDSGTLKAFGEGATLDLVPAADSGLSVETLSSVVQAINAAVAPVSENIIAELPTNLATVTTSTGTVVAIVAPGAGTSAGGGTTGGTPASEQEPNAFLSGDADVFDIQTSVGSVDRYRVDVFLENVFPDLVTGVPAFDISFSLSGSGLSLVAGSVSVASVSAENPANLRTFLPSGDDGGRVIAIYTAAHKFLDFSSPLVSFQVAKSNDAADEFQLEFMNLDIGGNTLSGSTYVLDI